MKWVTVLKRPGRKWWYFHHFDPKTGRRKCNVRSAFQVDDPQGYRKALDQANELSQRARVAKSIPTSERWEDWVEDFLKDKYRSSDLTLTRSLQSWKQWQAFLQQQELYAPRMLDYGAVMKFKAWRTAQKRRRSKKLIKHNTALLDIRLMKLIMDEAVRRGFAPGNCVVRLGMKADKAAIKPEITEADLVTIREALKTRPEWMSTAFEIALHQGCRHKETRVHRSDVDFDRGVITFRAKGGNVFGTKLHPGIVGLLRTRFANNEWSLEWGVKNTALAWHNFFIEVKLPNLCFHCTRVTVVTKMARAGVPIQQAMAYVGHASSLIHKIYQRLKPADLSAATSALKF